MKYYFFFPFFLPFFLFLLPSDFNNYTRVFVSKTWVVQTNSPIFPETVKPTDFVPGFLQDTIYLTLRSWRNHITSPSIVFRIPLTLQSHLNSSFWASKCDPPRSPLKIIRSRIILGKIPMVGRRKGSVMTVTGHPSTCFTGRTVPTSNMSRVVVPEGEWFRQDWFRWRLTG